MSISPKKSLTPFQPDRYVIAAFVFILIFAITGVTIEFISHASSPTPEIVSLVDGSSTEWCMSDLYATTSQDSPVYSQLCSGEKYQQFTYDSSTKTIELTALGGTHCVGIDGNMAAGTNIVLNSCDGESTQEWWHSEGDLFVDGGQRATSKSVCIAVYSGETGKQLRLATCDSSYGSQQWVPTTYGTSPPPTPPNPNPPTPTPPTPTKPTPTKPTPKKPSPTKPKPSPTHTGTGTTPTVTITPTASPTPTISLSPTPSTTPTISLQPTPSTSPSSSSNPPTTFVNTIPTISDFSITDLTTNSVTLKWQTNVISDYSIKYGLNPDKFSSTQTLATSKTIISYNLKGLPAGKKIYVQVTPTSSGVTGPAHLAAFITNSPSDAAGTIAIILGSIVGLLVFLALIRLFIMRLRERAVEAPEEVVDTSLPAYPQESTDEYASRLLWWLPNNEKQEAIKNATGPKQHKEDDVPDIFEEGRKRLEDEEKDNLLPKY